LRWVALAVPSRIPQNPVPRSFARALARATPRFWPHAKPLLTIGRRSAGRGRHQRRGAGGQEAAQKAVTTRGRESQNPKGFSTWLNADCHRIRPRGNRRCTVIQAPPAWLVLYRPVTPAGRAPLLTRTPSRLFVARPAKPGKGWGSKPAVRLFPGRWIGGEPETTPGLQGCPCPIPPSSVRSRPVHRL